MASPTAKMAMNSTARRRLTKLPISSQQAVAKMKPKVIAAIGDNFFVGTTTNVKTFNLGASYDFGVVKLFGEVSKAKNEVDTDSFLLAQPTDIDLKGWLLGATVPVGPGLIRVAYSAVKYDFNLPVTPFVTTDDPKANKFAIENKERAKPAKA